ncbi:MAG: hypothetical protein V1701_07925, partial [Planctomycetota bacterium]
FSGATFGPAVLKAGSGTIIFDSQTADQAIPALNYNHLQIDKYSGIVSYTANAGANGINVDGNFTVTSGIFKADPSNAGWSHTIAGDCEFGIANCEFKPQLSQITLDGVSQAITQNSNNFYKLNIGDGVKAPTVVMNGNLKVTNNLTVKSGSTLNLNSNTGHSVSGSVTIESGGKIDLTTGTLEITDGLVNSGTVDMDQVSILGCGAFTNTATGLLDCGSTTASQITVSGNWNDTGTVNPGYSTATLSGINKTITTSGSSDFYNLQINGNYTAQNNLDVSGNVTITGIFTPGGFTHRVGGNWNDSAGTFIAGSATIIFTGINQTINTDVGTGNNKFYKLTIGDGIATPSVQVTTGKDLEVGSNLLISAGSQLTLNANTAHTVGGTLVITGTLNTSTGKVTVSDSCTNAGTLNVSASIAVTQGLKCVTFTNTGNINFGISGSGMIECSGSWFDTGAFTLANSTVKLTGANTAIKANRATADFCHLIICGSVSPDVSSANGLDIDGTLKINTGGSLNLGVGFTHDVASILEVGDASTTGQLDINNSKLSVGGNFTVFANSTLLIEGSNTSAQVGELKMANNTIIYIQGFFQTNPAGMFVYHPKVTRAVTGARYDFIVQSGGGIDINGIVFEYAKKGGLTIQSTASNTNIDIDYAAFQFVEEDPSGTGQGNGARHIYIGFPSGTFTYNFDNCSFDTSFGTTTGNNIIAANTSGSTTVNFTNWSGDGAGDSYEWQGTNNSIIWIGDILWLGGTAGSETNWNVGTNWSAGSKPGEGSNVIIQSRSYNPTLNETTVIASLVVQNAGVLNMSAGYQLTVNGNLTIDGGATGGKVNISNAGAVLRGKSNFLDNSATGGVSQSAGKVILLGVNSNFYSRTLKTLEIGDGTVPVTVTTPAGKQVNISANGILTIKAQANYTLTNAQLTMGAGANLSVNTGVVQGRFNAGNSAVITTPAPGTDRFYFIVAGKIDFNGVTVSSTQSGGIDIQSTATIQNLSNVRFYSHLGTTSSCFLSIATSNLNLDCPGCWFDTITNGYNVSATGASSVIRFDDRFYTKGSGYDLITISDSNEVTSTTAAFVTKGVKAGDILRIGQGANMGTYEVSSDPVSNTILTLTANIPNSGSGITYNVGSALSGRGAGELWDSDDDAQDDGVADTGGALVLWNYTSGAEVQGTIEGFPSCAFDLNTGAYYSTYQVSKNIQGANTIDRIYVLDGNGDFKEYYYDVNNSYGDIVGSVWWYTEGTTHYLYFGTTDGWLFRLIDTGTALNPAAGDWPFRACTQITSAMITDGINLYFGGIDGVTPKIYGVIINSHDIKFAEPSVSAVRVTPSWENIGITTTLFAASDFKELQTDVSLKITTGQSYVTITNTAGLEAQDILVVTDALAAPADRGRFRILSVDGPTQVTTDHTFINTQIGLSYAAGRSVIYRLNVGETVVVHQNKSPFDHTRAPTSYWPSTNGLYVGDYYGRMHGVNTISSDFANLSGNFPAAPSFGPFSITTMAFIQFSPAARLLYVDMGGYFYVRNMDGSLYDPPNGPAYPFRPAGEANSTPMESSPMPNFEGLIYIGNNDGRVFVIDESKRAVIKTYSFGSGIKIGDISYDADTGRFLVPTNQGKIYYLENMSR